MAGRANRVRRRTPRRDAQAGFRLLVERPAQLTSSRRQMRKLLSEQGLHEQDREEIVLAANEAVINALQSCHAPECRVEVTASLIADYACVEVRDAGEGLKGICVDLITVAGPAEEHGRGLHLMRELMDSLEIVPRSWGTLVRLIRRLEAEESRAEAGDLERARVMLSGRARTAGVRRNGQGVSPGHQRGMQEHAARARPRAGSHCVTLRSLRTPFGAATASGRRTPGSPRRIEGHVAPARVRQRGRHPAR
jgi:anti-sigma regulatory factor (Ser/Thr protein kinase)